MDCWLCLVAATGDEERLVIVSYLMGAIVVSRFLLALWSERHIVRLNVHVCPSASLYSVSFARTHAYIYTYMLTHSLCLTVRAYMYECTCLSVCVCVCLYRTYGSTSSLVRVYACMYVLRDCVLVLRFFFSSLLFRCFPPRGKENRETEQSERRSTSSHGVIDAIGGKPRIILTAYTT